VIFISPDMSLNLRLKYPMYIQVLIGK